MTDSLKQTLIQSDYATLKSQKTGPNELRAMILANQCKINAMPSPMTEVMAVEAERMLCKMKACNMLLSEYAAEEERKNRAQQKINDAKERWNEKLPERKAAAILKLPAASSANGQLIAAILEAEGNLTERELRNWCEELAALDDEAFAKLMADLCTEKILYRRAGKYALATICDAELVPHFTEEYLLETLSFVSYPELMYPVWNAFVSSYRAGLTPFSVNELIAMKNMTAGNADTSEDRFTETVVRELARKGLLQKINAGAVTLYDVSLLGEL